MPAERTVFLRAIYTIGVFGLLELLGLLGLWIIRAIYFIRSSRVNVSRAWLEWRAAAE